MLSIRARACSRVPRADAAPSRGASASGVSGAAGEADDSPLTDPRLRRSTMRFTLLASSARTMRSVERVAPFSLTTV